MKEFIPVLKRTKLFSGVGDDDISTMLTCLGARLLTYKKGEHVLRQGEHLSDILVLAEGSLHIQRDDYWGKGEYIEKDPEEAIYWLKRAAAKPGKAGKEARELLSKIMKNNDLPLI